MWPEQLDPAKVEHVLSVIGDRLDAFASPLMKPINGLRHLIHDPSFLLDIVGVLKPVADPAVAAHFDMILQALILSPARVGGLLASPG